MCDTPKNIRNLVNMSHIAFFTALVIISVLLIFNDIVDASTVGGGEGVYAWSYDESSSNLESAIVMHKLFMPENTNFLNNEDSGFPFNEPIFDGDGMATTYTKFPSALYDVNFLSNFVLPETFNKSNNQFLIPKIFYLSGVQYDSTSFSCAMMFAQYYDYHPHYYLVLCNDSSVFSAYNRGAGFFFYKMNDSSSTDGVIIFEFSEGARLVSITKPHQIYEVPNALFYGPLPLCGNCPIYSYYTDLVPRGDHPDWYYRVDSSDVENINYLQLGSGKVYPDGSAGDKSNNLYMRTADWIFNIPRYKTHLHSESNNWGQGDVRFQGLLNDYQKSNANEFALKFEFYIQFDTRMNSTVHNTNQDYNRIYSTDYTVPLQTFIDGNNSYSWSVDSIFHDSGISELFTDLYTKYDDQWQMTKTSWNMECKATLVSVGEHSQGELSSSGSIVENYNFLTQISNETENNITKNKNPVKDDDGNIQYDPSHDDENSDDDSTITTKDGQIILTNNDNDSNHQVVNIDNGHDEIINTLYDKLVPPDSNSNGGLTQRFLDLTQTNRWFDVMATAMPYIPIEFWSTMIHLLVVCTGILGIAFLIWIVCHIV